MRVPVQIQDLDLLFDLARMADRVDLLITMIKAYKLLLILKSQLPPLGSLMPENIWVLRPDQEAQIMSSPGRHGANGR